MPRPASIAIAVTLIALVGWATWNKLATSISVDNGESIADLEGFESAPAFTPESNTEDVPEPGLGEMGSLAAPDTDDQPIAISKPRNKQALVIPKSSSEVWLTGTIEDNEPTEKIELPERLSGGQPDNTILR